MTPRPPVTLIIGVALGIALALAAPKLWTGAVSPADAKDEPRPTAALSAKLIQDRDYAPRSNTEASRRILANAPPAAPGYRQFMGFISAVLTGKAEIVPIEPPVPETLSAHPDLTYVTLGDRELKLDLYRPRKVEGPAPLVVLIHGGCWMDGSRKEMGHYSVNLARLGYVTASVEYRLSEEAPYPAAIEDIRKAIQWLRTNAAEYLKR